ncbi:MAG: 50S ribosomal protein L29 [Candidatus Heimdallarchaeaceae archaeon]|uniref:Large ribosomal subunit protein uL29 n=1 Tax=Candidatus Heimdallarchaeum endolithica TaxID=2876572 RepID=A0A9Y1FN14_9ARCH|nr:MAG: 50S ribosomal protein L29 [Candidatus Heimdallarchaeum endolithica]
MGELKPTEIRKLTREQKLKKLEEYKQKLFKVKSELASGGSIENPGQIQEYKRTIARILTILTEEGEL